MAHRTVGPAHCGASIAVSFCGLKGPSRISSEMIETPQWAEGISWCHKRYQAKYQVGEAF